MIVQAATLAMAVLAIIWHQTRTTEKLREDFTSALGELTNKVDDNGQRLARIEGFLGIGMPQEATGRAAGAIILPADKR